MNRVSLLAVVSAFFLLSGCSGTMPKLGVMDGQLQPCPDKPNCVYSMSTDERHAVSPILVNASEKDAKLAIMGALEQVNGKVVEVRNDYIKAEFESRLFRFVDDVEFYFPRTDPNQTLIHIRSASRVGYSDMGVNRERVEKIREIVETIAR